MVGSSVTRSSRFQSPTIGTSANLVRGDTASLSCSGDFGDFASFVTHMKVIAEVGSMSPCAVPSFPVLHHEERLHERRFDYHRSVRQSLSHVRQTQRTWDYYLWALCAHLAGSWPPGFSELGVPGQQMFLPPNYVHMLMIKVAREHCEEESC